MGVAYGMAWFLNGFLKCLSSRTTELEVLLKYKILKNCHLSETLKKTFKSNILPFSMNPFSFTYVKYQIQIGHLKIK